MKKRIISIFLIVSIVVSLLAISAANTSAYSKYAPAPKLTSITTKGYNLHVTWTHSGYATEWYTVWVHKWYTDPKQSSNWKKYTSYGKSIDIGSLENGATYDIKVSAHDEMGYESKYSNVGKRTFLINPKLYSPRWGTETLFTQDMVLSWTSVPKADYYVVWGQYRRTDGGKWSSWQTNKIIYDVKKHKIPTTYLWRVKKGYTFNVKVSAVKDGCHSDYSSMWNFSA